MNALRFNATITRKSITEYLSKSLVVLAEAKAAFCNKLRVTFNLSSRGTL